MRSTCVAAFAVLVLTAALADAQSDWVTVSPPGMGFRAEFPSQPRYLSTPNRSPAGVWVGSTWEVDEVDTDRAFQVTVKDYSDYDTGDAPIDRVLEATCRGIDRTARISPLPNANVPARRCLVERGIGGTEMHVRWRAPRLYVVSQICGRDPCDQAARRRFLRSFRLL